MKESTQFYTAEEVAEILDKSDNDFADEFMSDDSLEDGEEEESVVRSSDVDIDCVDCEKYNKEREESRTGVRI